ncbi:30S ribosomal protein S9 [Candidatus Dependentiae bacterium]|nr:30S ribosomal protein S9 [Candidatus Dependentiae bacterium]
MAPVHGVGRRKSSVARVWMRRGSGKLIVNGLDYTKYFDTDINRMSASFPLKVINLAKTYDFEANVQGGGMSGQADAIKLGISRAILEKHTEAKPVLKEHGLITVDSRVKERKKYGQKAARRKFQFVKR